MAASMAAVILAAGTKGKRYALPNSTILLHQLAGGFKGQATDIDIHAKEILRLKKLLNEVLALHTGQDIARVERDTDRDNFMTPEEAVAYGIIDEVVKNRAEVEKRDSK